MKSPIGLIGLGTMGSALAQNLASRGFRVSVWNRSSERIAEFVQKHGEDNYYMPKNFEDFVESLEKPRKIIVMVPAGEATASVLEQLKMVLEEGDCILDGGNSFYKDTEALQARLMNSKIHLLGAGVAGGERDALLGPSLMLGGSAHAWEAFKPFLTAIAAEDFEGGACAAYMGKGGAGAYVKMVHNGIESAEIQSLAEAYTIFKELYRLPNNEIADIFKEWSEGRYQSILSQVAVEALQREEERPLLGHKKKKCMGQWMSEEALRKGQPTPSITGSVFAQHFSTNNAKQSHFKELFPRDDRAPMITLSEIKEHLEKALFMARILHFEQGLQLLRVADHKHEFGLPFDEIFRVWQGGCIIRCASLKDMQKAVQEKDSLLEAEPFKTELKKSLNPLKEVLALQLRHSLPSFALSGALNTFEAIRQDLPTASFIL